MREEKLLAIPLIEVRKVSLQEVLDELDIIECFEVPGLQLQVGETTRRQMELYAKLGVTPPTSLQ